MRRQQNPRTRSDGVHGRCQWLENARIGIEEHRSARRFEQMEHEFGLHGWRGPRGRVDGLLDFEFTQVGEQIRVREDLSLGDILFGRTVENDDDATRLWMLDRDRLHEHTHQRQVAAGEAQPLCSHDDTNHRTPGNAAPHDGRRRRTRVIHTPQSGTRELLAELHKGSLFRSAPWSERDESTGPRMFDVPRRQSLAAGQAASVGGRNAAVGVHYWRFAYWVLLAYPIMWMLGFGAAVLSLLGLVGLVVLFRSRITLASALPLIVAGAILISSAIGVLVFGFLPDRIIGMIGNLLVWVAIAALIATRDAVDSYQALLRILSWTALTQGVVILAALIAYPSTLGVPVLGALGFSLPSGLSEFANPEIVRMDWLGGERLRSIGTMGNPTWSGAVGVIGVIASIGLTRNAPMRWRIMAVAGIAGGGLAIACSLSRALYPAAAAAALVGLILLIHKRSPLAAWITSGVTVVLGLTLALSMAGQILDWLGAVNEDRAGSLTSRSGIYERTWEYVVQLIVPFFGYGIKPQYSDLVASVATHSTYLGLLFRGGIIALAACLAFLWLALRTSVRTGNLLASILVVFVAAWCVLEDLDVGHLVPLALVFAFCTKTPAATLARWSFSFRSNRRRAPERRESNGGPPSSPGERQADERRAASPPRPPIPHGSAL
jgi:hypothetical protein